jgi:hypothetical protein
MAWLRMPLTAWIAEVTVCPIYVLRAQQSISKLNGFRLNLVLCEDLCAPPPKKKLDSLAQLILCVQ